MPTPSLDAPRSRADSIDVATIVIAVITGESLEKLCRAEGGKEIPNGSTTESSGLYGESVST